MSLLCAFTKSRLASSKSGNGIRTKSGTTRPTKASMATRPCFSSASRYHGKCCGYLLEICRGSHSYVPQPWYSEPTMPPANLPSAGRAMTPPVAAAERRPPRRPAAVAPAAAAAAPAAQTTRPPAKVPVGAASGAKAAAPLCCVTTAGAPRRPPAAKPDDEGARSQQPTVAAAAASVTSEVFTIVARVGDATREARRQRAGRC
mmetsp:Transcript_13073/g.32921  ORF Transcript_13073/g.32921 Transcript_13073/m.32921 type:complete len:203 (+) Transcript_13073:254-862(+)